MKLTSKFLTASLCAALLGVAGMAQSSQPAAPAAVPAKLPPAPTVTGPSRIGVIDLRAAITDTAEGKRLLDNLQAQFAPRRADLKTQQDAITRLQAQLKNGGNTMSDSAKQDLTRQIQTKQRDYQQTLQNDQSDFQNAQTEILNTVGNKMMPIVEKYAKDHGYTAIVDVSFQWPQSPVLYYNPGAVITGDIVRLYDKANLPSAASSGPTSPGGQR
ncbi:MAG: OmpH family outer membrane protein [Terriglobales bacterium]